MADAQALEPAFRRVSPQKEDIQERIGFLDHLPLELHIVLKTDIPSL